MARFKGNTFLNRYAPGRRNNSFYEEQKGNVDLEGARSKEFQIPVSRYHINKKKNILEMVK